MLGRRGFLKTIGAAVLGMSLALKAPERKMFTRLRYDVIRDFIEDDFGNQIPATEFWTGSARYPARYVPIVDGDGAEGSFWFEFIP